MKRVLFFVLIGSICLTMAACAGSSLDSTASTDAATIQATTEFATETTKVTEKSTELTTEKPTDPPTEAPTENPNKSAYKAYMDNLSENYDLINDTRFTDYDTKADDHVIALKDINNDGIDELIYVKYADSSYMIINLTVLSYSNGALETMYDDFLINIPGAGPTYNVFLNSSGELYSVATNYPNVKITQYSVSESSVTSEMLAESKGQGTDNPDVKYFISDSAVSEDKFSSYKESILSDEAISLCHYEIEPNASDISMSYAEAYDYLTENS